VPNPNNVAREEIRECLGRLYLDAAATVPSALGPGAGTVGSGDIVYRADYGMPCSTEETIEANRHAVLGYGRFLEREREVIKRNALVLFPAAR
jgi:hypothetical protein